MGQEALKHSDVQKKRVSEGVNQFASSIKMVTVILLNYKIRLF